MGTNKKGSFGYVLRKAQDLIAFLATFFGYSPPRTEESVPEMEALANGIVGLNAAEIALEETYRLSVDARSKALVKGNSSAWKTLMAVKGVVDSQYGKKSPEAAIIGGILKKMQPANKAASTSPPTVAGQQNDDAQARAYSRSQRSFGSITQLFNDVVNALQQFTAYAPTNDALKVASLQATALHLTQLNDDVAHCYALLKQARTDRNAKYADLRERIKRIKSYVNAQYGSKSQEAAMIRGTGI